MPWIAATIGAVGSLGGAALGANAASNAAQAQQRAAREADNLAYSQYLTSLGLQTPYYGTGINALNELNALFGYGQQAYQDPVSLAQQNRAAGQSANTRLGAKAVLKLLKQGKSISEIAQMGTLRSNSGVVNRLGRHGVSAGDINALQAGPFGQMQQGGAGAGAPYSGPTGLDVFKASPDYQFRRNEGNRDILGGFGAAGGAFSGNALRALTDFNQNLASGEYQNFINRRMALAGYGQNAANQASGAAQNYGYQGAQMAQDRGDARASGIANAGQMWGQGLMGAGQALGGYFANRQPRFNGDAFNASSSAYFRDPYPDLQPYVPSYDY